MFKKLLSVVLSAAMLFSAVAFLPAEKSIVQPETVMAAETFTPRLTKPSTDNGYYFANNVFYQYGYGMPNCTCYAFGRAYELLGHVPALSHGNACEWYDYNRNTGAYDYGRTPKLGAIACWTGGDGHVAVVEKINGNVVTISQSSWGGTFFEVKDIPNLSDEAGFQGYIYIGDWTDKIEGHVMKESEAAGQTIPDGDYLIYSALNPWYFLDVTGTGICTENRTNVQMNIGREYQDYHYWTVTYLNNGFYRIMQKGGTKCLDISGDSMYAGANVQMFECEDGALSEQWSIKPTSTGYSIQSKRNSFFLDVLDGDVESGTNVQLWKDNGGDAQRFCFVPIDSDERPLSDGTYNIRSVAAPDYYLDASGVAGEYENGTNIQIWKGAQDSFVIKYAGGGWYEIYEECSGLAVTVDPEGSYMKNTTNILLCEDNAYRRQLWRFVPTDDGHYNIFTKLNGYYLDLEYGKGENGQNVSQHTANGNIAQKWDLIPLECKSIKITPPTKTKYIVGEKIDTKGMQVTATFMDGTTGDITNSVKLDYTNTKAGNITVTVSYSDQKATFQVTYVDKSDIFEGSGTKSDPYLIHNKTELETFRDLVNSVTYNEDFGGKYYKLTSDIDLKNEKWTPIGKNYFDGKQTSRRFFGSFDGNDHTVKGLNVSETTKFAGLFGSMDTGGIIENLAVEGTVKSANSDADAGNISVGGIVGEIGNGTVRNCSFIGDVSGDKYAIGGIVGYLWQSGTVENCYHNGTITGKGTGSAGGIVGRIASGAKEGLTCKIENCYHVGALKNVETNCGTIYGFVDRSDNPCTIKVINCYGLTTDGKLYGDGKADVMEMDDKTSAELKKLGAELLGDAFVKNPSADFNGGYPVFPWQAALKGDTNADGTVTVLDLVLLQKYLHKTGQLVDAANADLNADGLIDVYDLALLKRLLIAKTK